MDLKPSLLSYIFMDCTHWRLSYTFPQLTLELDGQTTKLNTEQALEIHIHKGWIWSSITLKTLNQNFILKGIFNTQAEKLQIEVRNDAEFLQNKKNAEKIKTVLEPYLSEYEDFINQNIYLSNYFSNLFRSNLSQRSKADVERFNSLIKRDATFGF